MGCFGYKLISIVFIYSLFDIYWGYAIEPKCSKFAYEESLLEKMVRMEFSVQTVLDSIKTTQSEVKNELEKLKSERELIERKMNEFGDRITQEKEEFSNQIKEERDEFEVKVASMQNDAVHKLNDLENITEIKLSTLTKEINDNIEFSEGVIARISEDFKDLKNGSIQAIIDSAKKPNILFRARELNDRSPSANQKLVFQTVLENQGDGYNEDTGIFTAPVSGDYLFTVQLCSDSTNDFVFSFMRDGIHQQRLEFQQGSYGCGTAVYVTNVKVKSKISIESRDNYGSDILYTDSYRWNVFSGILIK